MKILPQYHCPLTTCKLNAVCQRSINFQEEKNDDFYSILNPEKIQPGENGCPHLLVKKPVTVAYGFKKLYTTLPECKTHYTQKYFPMFKSDSSYYRAKRGETELFPQDQEEILKIFAQLGADTKVGFDKYGEGYIFISPNQNS